MEEQTPQESLISEQRFEETLNHAKAGYANSQETIRFVDSKTGILTGIVLVTTGIPFALLQIIPFKDETGSMSFATWIKARESVELISVYALFGLAVLAIFFGVMSLLASTSGLMSRHPRRGDQREKSMLKELVTFLFNKVLNIFGRSLPHPKDPPPVTSLFPLYPPHRIHEARLNFANIAIGNYSRLDVLREYGLQLESVGALLDTKISHNRDAVRWFELQIVSYFLTALPLAYLIYGWLKSASP